MFAIVSAFLSYLSSLFRPKHELALESLTPAAPGPRPQEANTKAKKSGGWNRCLWLK
jgi:hypothetical protein